MERNIMKGKASWSAEGRKAFQECKTVDHCQMTKQAIVTAAILGAVLLIGIMVAPLCAQSYPDKPIRLIMPFGTGGTTDTLARIIGPKLAERLGQPVLPENHGGAGGNIGHALVAKARPDGYTILLGSPTLTVSPSLYKKLNYDPIKDFAPISLVAELPYVLVVRVSLPVNNLKELVKLAKANPGKLTYGTSGIGATPHLSIELFKSLAKIDMVNVSYKDAGQMLTGLLSGEVDMLVVGPTAAVPLIQAGKVKALAMLSKERLPTLPDVPTSKEAGIDNWETTSWWGFIAPAGTPRDIINRWNAEWTRIAAMPDTKKQLQNAQFETLSCTPEQFSEYIKAQIVRWAKVIKDADIKAQD